MKREKILWIFLVFAVLAGLTWQFFPLEDSKERLMSLPLEGQGFSGKDLRLKEYEKKFFKKVNLLKREYTVGSDTFFVFVLDGTNNRHAIHDPTYCFRGGGWEIIHQEPFPLKNVSAFRYFLERGKEKKEALLWFSNGKERYTSFFRYWMETTARRLLLGITGNEPILIILAPKSGVFPNWSVVFEKFTPILDL